TCKMRPINRNAAPDRAAEESMNRQVQRLCPDVEERIADCADGLLVEAARRLKGLAGQLDENGLDTGRILTDQRFDVARDQGIEAEIAGPLVIFRPAHDA